LLQEVARAYTERRGPEDEKTRAVVRSLGLACVKERRWADLEPYVDRFSAEVLRQNPNQRDAHLVLKARCQLEAGKFAEAEKTLRTLAGRPPSPNSPGYSWQSMLGAALLGQKRWADAEPLLVRGYEWYANLEADDPKRPWLFSDAGAALVRLYEAWGKPDQAAEQRRKVAEAAGMPDWTQTRARVLEDAVARRKADLGPDHPQTLTVMHNLGVMYEKLGRFDRAEALLQDAVRLSKGRKDARGLDYSLALNNLARVAFEAGHPDTAMAAVNEYLDIVRRGLEPNDPRRAGGLAEVVTLLLRHRQFAAAEPIARECLAAREKNQPDDWRTFNTRSLLGEALLGQRKYADAEPLLLAGYEGMKQRQDKIPPAGKMRLPEALERLVRLYEATGRKDKADEWRKKLDE
jgi:tetratricopeptide (TPR) repeat protein